MIFLVCCCYATDETLAVNETEDQNLCYVAVK